MNENNSKISSEILAVIAAAISSIGAGAGRKLEVKAIRRISQTSPVWNTTGRIERLARNLNSR